MALAPVTLLFLTLFSAISTAQTAPTDPLKALVQRQLPQHADSFVFHLGEQAQINMKTHSELDTFTIFDLGDGKVHIECSTKSACTRGLYTYFR
jgi:alpha-N-acetylglucosaminidase